MADVTKYIDPDEGSGHDYHSLNLWEDGEDGDITAIGCSIAVCRCTAETADTTRVTIDGWTTDATHYIKIWTDPVESYRHSGVYDVTKFRLTTSDSNNFTITIYEDYVRIHGLQIKNSAANAEGRGIVSAPPGDNSTAVKITECIVVGNPTATQDGSWGKGINCNSGHGEVDNCIVYGFDIGISAETTRSSTIQNCTISNCNTGLERTNGTATIKNTYSGGNTTTDYTGTMSFTTSASSDSTDRTGVTKEIAYSASSGAYFVSITENSEDFHIGASSALKDAGTDLSTIFTTDIDGETRPTGTGTWDIGADEYVAAGGTIPLSNPFSRPFRQAFGRGGL